MIQYTVVAGDTLYSIGLAHGLSQTDSAAQMILANPQLNGSTNLAIGSVVNIPVSDAPIPIPIPGRLLCSNSNILGDLI